MSSSQQTAVLKKIDLHEGDILHIQLGGDVQISGRTETWVPTQQDLEETLLQWAPLVADKGCSIIVTHHLVEATILATKLNLSTWPPNVIKSP